MAKPCEVITEGMWLITQSRVSHQYKRPLRVLVKGVLDVGLTKGSGACDCPHMEPQRSSCKQRRNAHHPAVCQLRGRSLWVWVGLHGPSSEPRGTFYLVHAFSMQGNGSEFNTGTTAVLRMCVPALDVRTASRLGGLCLTCAQSRPKDKGCACRLELHAHAHACQHNPRTVTQLTAQTGALS